MVYKFYEIGFGKNQWRSVLLGSSVYIMILERFCNTLKEGIFTVEDIPSDFMFLLLFYIVLSNNIRAKDYL